MQYTIKVQDVSQGVISKFYKQTHNDIVTLTVLYKVSPGLPAKGQLPESPSS